MKILLPLASLMVLWGCNDPQAAKLAGKWEGGFEGAPKGQEAMRPEWRYSGYLQLYATDRRFTMHLESSAQIIDIKGNWTQSPGRIELNIAKVDFDDLGGSLLRKPGVNPIAPEVIREDYGRTVVLEKSSDEFTLTGLPMSIGPLLGKHVFRKSQANTRFPDEGK